MKHLKFRTYSITLVFLAGILFPFINKKINVVKDIESFENRRMASEPGFDIEHLDPYPSKFDSFYNDNFNLRNRFIRYFNLYNILAFHKSPIPGVVIGNDNWLFPEGDEMDSYLGKNRFTTRELELFKTELEARKKYLEERGIKFYFMVVPCKASIHSEPIGLEYFRLYKDSWGEQLINYLNKNCSVKLINLFEALREEKKKHDLYFKLDNHWNKLGAFYAANEVIKQMKPDFPELEPLSINDFEVKQEGICGGNIQRMLGDLDIYSEPCTEVIPKNGFKSSIADKGNYPITPGFAYPWEFEEVREIKGSKKPKLLIISDSFGKNIFPFLAENFSKTVKIFDAWQYNLNANVIDGEKPDILLLQIDEPILRNFIRNK
jgi:alginate O-acetyltransferase complex protein AlgJ